MDKLEIFCVTDVSSKLLEKLNLNLVGVGKKKFSKKYISVKKGVNIQKKEKHYSELTFHYWFWKNKLKKYDQKTWIGFSQKRRFWIKNKCKITSFETLKSNLLNKIPLEWKNYNSVICKSISVKKPKKIKLLKRGWKNLILDPQIMFKEKKQTVELHFDMFHGFGFLKKAIEVMNDNDRNEFSKYVKSKNKFNANIMYISKKDILDKWFKDLFTWLSECEKIFGFNLSGYDNQRIYAFLAERYASFWFKKYSKPITWHWTFFDITKWKNEI